MVHLRGGSSGYSPSLFTIWCRILFFYHHSWCSIFRAERRNTLLRHYFQLVTFCVQCPTHCLTYSLTSAVILMQGTQYYILPSLVQFSYSLVPNTLLSASIWLSLPNTLLSTSIWLSQHSKYTVVGVSGKLIEDTLTCSAAGYKTMTRVTKH